MSVRVHTTSAEYVNVVLVTDPEKFNGLYDDDASDNVPALVIEDPANMEALVIMGALDELRELSYDIASVLDYRVIEIPLKDFEDERGYLWEAPDDEGRIRVRDFDGNSVTWYDPGNDGYDDAIARFKEHA